MNITDDSVVENEEQFALSILNLTSQCNVAVAGQRSHNVTIIDNDGNIVIIIRVILLCMCL